MSELVTAASGAYTPESQAPRAPLSPEAFEAMLVAVLPAAYAYALRLAREPADAEDLVQEAALLAFRGASGFAAGTNFKAWFFRIVTTSFWGSHRARRRRPQTVEYDDAPELGLYALSAQNGLPQTGEDPAAPLLDALGTERIAAAIADLPEEFSAVCTLYFMEDFTYQEIADVLDVPVGTVRSRLHRGRRMLQQALWQAARDAGIVEDRA
ncbi:RNA polymerase sigma factor, sigma-70 family [Gemmatirosa kalamazoonensis]|uniref:RNA polymerase sigma factor, sigma-70 family n=1 Tax=Gemmatirosa kalamazoonensis TaxID=861299 RepID=W0RKX6_9BACT|nr:sigma-70 family RNA polymerase sigma factor [Gemmatirosa kalamazoonensis]AHG91421.1 RNA polymerase sigma factor, sigma-70 family [Gemmatirosa kalamazoonensis]